MILRVTEQGGEQLRYLAELGLIPGTTVELVAHAPFDGPVSLRIAGRDHALSRSFASALLVGPPEPERS